MRGQVGRLQVVTRLWPVGLGMFLSRGTKATLSPDRVFSWPLHWLQVVRGWVLSASAMLGCWELRRFLLRHAWQRAQRMQPWWSKQQRAPQDDETRTSPVY